MSEEKVITEEEVHTNPLLGMAVTPNSELQEYLVEYVGTKLDNEEVLATDFPEFAFAYAEENFLRGYKLGLEDAKGLYTAETETSNRTTD